MLSPNHLDVLLHYYVSSADHDRLFAPAVKEAIDMFLEKQMLRWEGDRLRTTEKADFWIKHILAVPFPVRQFRIPEHGEA